MQERQLEKLEAAASRDLKYCYCKLGIFDILASSLAHLQFYLKIFVQVQSLPSFYSNQVYFFFYKFIISVIYLGHDKYSLSHIIHITYSIFLFSCKVFVIYQHILSISTYIHLIIHSG